MTDLDSLAVGCAKCRVCDGAAYQTPPVFFAGRQEAPIIAIGQNPGEIKDVDIARQQWIQLFNAFDLTNFVPSWYLWDFVSSPGYHILKKVFGENWLANGEVVWTNAVRCRTKNNASPSRDMIEACKVWTDALLQNRKAIIMVGAVSRLQILGPEAAKLDWGIPRKHARFGYLLAIKYYAAWDERDPIVYAEAFERIRLKVKNET